MAGIISDFWNVSVQQVENYLCNRLNKTPLGADRLFMVAACWSTLPKKAVKSCSPFFFPVFFFPWTNWVVG